jgi:SAM-dependent methyltransferase
MQECLLYTEPELYDLLFPNARDSTSVLDPIRQGRLLASEQFYLEETAKGGPILELACGTGRLTVPVAQRGIEIVGIDNSQSMLETARAKAAGAGMKIEFIQGDMRSLDLPRKFAFIFIAGNSLQHLLTPKDLQQCFACARRHLTPGGRLVFDVANPDQKQLERDSGERVLAFKVKDAGRGDITLEETAKYNSATRIRQVTWYLSAPGSPDFRVIDYVLRMTTAADIMLALEATGFHVDTCYGEYTRIPFEPASPRQVYLCSVSS